eukprot:3471876-Ditylum_brightwellii.AAC.1
MQNSKKHQYLNEDQHGGCNGRTATDIVLRKSFLMDTFHMQQVNATCMDCDVKACYNCILPIALLLAYFKAGLLYDTCAFFASISYNMQYYITTALGVAVVANYFGLFGPIYSISQGATDGLLGWICIVDVVFKCYDHLAKGCLMQDPACLITQEANLDVFVDDAMHNHNYAKKNIPPTQLMHN